MTPSRESIIFGLCSSITDEFNITQMEQQIMRQIEKQMLNAISARGSWISSNTRVTTSTVDHVTKSEVFLHENHIATFTHGAEGTGWLDVNLDTLADWPTPTTKSRLNALGASVHTHKHVIHIDGAPVEQRRIEKWLRENPQVGKLCRDGKDVFYVTLPGGSTREIAPFFFLGGAA